MFVPVSVFQGAPLSMCAAVTSCAPVVIYGQEVLYVARGQDARSHPAKAGIQEAEAEVLRACRS